MTDLQSVIEKSDLEGFRRINEKDQTRIEELTDAGEPMALYAARVSDTDLVKYIVEYTRASMNLTDAQNRNILHYAAESGNLETNRYLVEKVGMDILAGDKNLITPYQIAWERQDSKLLSYYESVVGAPYEKMYHNPIRRGFFPDPSIVRVGEDYYMVNSSFIFFPCIPISHSKDLIHWEIIGHAITDPQWSMLSELEGGRGYWAPDISYDNGTFYITATYRLNDTGTVYRKQIVVSSKKPEGPYSKPAIIEEDGIDPSIFHENGRHYMLLNRGARIFELSPDCTRKISEAKLLYYGDHKRAPEGPHLLKKDGYYYLFLAEGGTGPGHRITVARSRELMGNYTPCPYNPIMRQMDEQATIQRCGHGKPVCTQNGDWYMVYLCGRAYEGKYSMLGRETAIDPITWTEDGWPMVNHLKGPSVLQIAPKLPTQAAGDCRGPESINRYEWMTPREPSALDAIRIEKDGFYIRASQKPLWSVTAQNVLLRRQTAFNFSASAHLKWQELYDGQEVGICCYYDENTWVKCCLCKKDDRYNIEVAEHIGTDTKICIEKELKSYGLETQEDLIFCVETIGLERSFFLVQENLRAKICTLSNVYYLCDEGIRMGKRFTGALVGMYAYSKEKPLTAHFYNFEYIE